MKKKLYLLVIIVMFIMAAFTGFFILHKNIRAASVFAKKYELCGVDVSHYQGSIDFAKIKEQDIDFAFIKATEGSGYVDECFDENWENAQQTELFIGAYHFFSFDSSGKMQAGNFINTVGSLGGKLPPVVDVEYYGDKESNLSDRKSIVKQLKEMLTILEEHYQTKPIIYTTYKAYDDFIKGEFEEYPLWIRNVYYPPRFKAGNKWVFWQYTDTAVLEGYEGSEKYIDMNVFSGTQEELENMIVQCEDEEALAEEVEAKDPDSFLLWNEEEEKEEVISLDVCNLAYAAGQVKVYSYFGKRCALYIFSPESEAVIYPVKGFWMDQEQEAIWLLESNEALQIKKIDLRQEHFLKETLILEQEEMEAWIADTYGLLVKENEADFWDLSAVLSGREEEDGEISLGGTASGVYKETNKKFEIVYEIDRESGDISAKGYLQDLAIHPLYQEFLFHNLTVENPFTENEMGLGKNLSFFDDEVYLSELGNFHKRFAVIDNEEDGEQELLFDMKQIDGKEELIYVLAVEKGKLICQDILKSSSAGWLDCASFLEIPTENCKDYKSRDEVFSAIEEGDFSVVVSKYSDPDRIVEELERAYKLDGDTRRTKRCDIDGDGFKELLLLIKYDSQGYEQIDFILDYRNGRAVCTYLDWCDGNEWLFLGNAGKLIHCSFSNNGWCTYYGFNECTLNARGIKDIDYAGNGIEVCDAYKFGESGFWWWEGQQPQITQIGIYFTKVRSKNDEEINDTGTASGQIKELILKEQFLKEYKELTEINFTFNMDLDKEYLIVTDSRGGVSELGYTDKEAFLKDFNFGKKAPFYQYCDENGELQLELYYDETTGRGCGIRYYPGREQTPKAFLFNGSDKESDSEFIQKRLNTDPYELRSWGGIDLSKDDLIEDYEEDIEYISDGRPRYFKSQGWITYIDEEKKLRKLLEIKFTYREDGTLKQRDYAHSTVALETWNSVIHSFYDRQERLLYEECYITHGSMDYYYIYQGEELTPSYCLVMDDDLGSLYAELLSIHDIIEDEDGKQYGIVGPDLSDNHFVKAVREAGDYRADQISHTYECNYDSDRYYEAFVIIGDYMDMWGEVTEDQITGDLWFVDHDNNAVYLQRHTFNVWQEYIRQDGKTYLFLNHEFGLPWITEIYTVQDNAPIVCAGDPAYCTKYLNELGQVIQVQDTYDGSYEIGEDYGWSGHTRKPYTFEFDHGELRETGAKEVTLKDVVKIAPLPDSFDEKEYAGVQYILRDNGELNINIATYDAEFGYINFGYLTYYVNKNGEWELTDEGQGFYLIQFNGESHWDYLDTIMQGKKY